MPKKSEALSSSRVSGLVKLVIFALRSRVVVENLPASHFLNIVFFEQDTVKDCVEIFPGLWK